MSAITSDILLEVTPEEEQNQEQDKRPLCDQEGGGDPTLIMSLHDVVRPRPPPSPTLPQPQSLQDQITAPLLDELSSPLSAQIFDFCDDPDIFPDTLQNSEVTSSPNCCYDEHNSSYATNILHNNNNNSNHKFSTQPLDIANFQGDQNDQTTNNSTTSSTTTTATTVPTPSQLQHQNNSLSIIFDSQDEIDNDISASIDFSPSRSFSAPVSYNINPTTNMTQQNQYQLPLNDITISSGLSQYSLSLLAGPPPPLGTVFEDDCLSSVPPFLRPNPSSAAASSPSSCTFFGPTIGSFLTGNLNHSLGSDNSGIFTESLLTELRGKDMDFQGDNGALSHDQLPRVYNSGDMQAFSNESSQLGCGAGSPVPLTTEISSLENSSTKAEKLSVEQRKEKIRRYLEKRKERNFKKKIKYACRKTLADSRPRVRGRFAKNDEFGEPQRHMNGHHDDDDYDEIPVVKEEDDLVDSSDIFSHISGVNSFKCNYQIQSWI